MTWAEFPHIHARSLFFSDPEGNRLELIAHDAGAARVEPLLVPHRRDPLGHLPSGQLIAAGVVVGVAREVKTPRRHLPPRTQARDRGTGRLA